MATADITDRDGAIQMILLNQDNLSCVKKFLVDKDTPANALPIRSRTFAVRRAKW